MDPNSSQHGKGMAHTRDGRAIVILNPEHEPAPSGPAFSASPEHRTHDTFDAHSSSKLEVRSLASSGPASALTASPTPAGVSVANLLNADAPSVTTTAQPKRNFYDPLSDSVSTSARATSVASDRRYSPSYQHPDTYSHHSQPAASAALHSPAHSRHTSASTPARGFASASPTKHTTMASPTLRRPSMGALGSPAPNGSSYAHGESPEKTPAPVSASKRSDPMSFSSILSSTEPVEVVKEKSAPPTESEPEPSGASKGMRVLKLGHGHLDDKKRAPRRMAKPRVSSARAKDFVDGDDESVMSEASKGTRRVSAKLATPDPRIAIKRTANGQQKKRPSTSLPLSTEKGVQTFLKKLDDATDDFDQNEYFENSEYEEELLAWKERQRRHKNLMVNREAYLGSSRRSDLADTLAKRLGEHSELGSKRYYEIYYDEALDEVRQQELFAEKERKKDMQRKRRREKSMAVTLEQKKMALERAAKAQDETERQKLLREAERANKKAQQTKLILQKGIKGPVRSGTLDLELEESSILQGTDAESSKLKIKGRGGPRPKKSREQKMQEKLNAEAAQAAIDAGELPPSKEETSKIRIKFKKSSAIDTGRDDTLSNREDMEPKPSKKLKEKVVEPVKDPLELKYQTKGYNQIYDQIWRDMARKDVAKTYRLATESYGIKASNLKKTALLASKEAKRWQQRTNKGNKDLQARAKRVMRDMMTFWKRNEREERDMRKAAEKQELENARKEEAEREAARQKRKLNFLISQTELYSHFIGKKIKTDEVERSTDHPDEVAKRQAEGGDNADAAKAGLNVDEPTGPLGKVTDFENLDFDAEDETQLRAAAMANAQNAIAEAQQKARAFNDMDEEGEMNFQNPTGLGDVEIEQPKLLNAQLKEYQLKGLNWLVNLYEQGINGILADEMGLGKTVQSISVMAYLAEKHDIWGPFLVVAPASTLHNWQQEIQKFVPDFKVLPYWGSGADRKVLRKFWDRKHSIYKKNAPFHVMVTSYQLVVSDVAFMSKMKWQYMILDEAQAIKSSQSSRWKVLLNYHCRNRLLLTGTPIQNNMQELWALLHFIMPSLFDSHDEFSEWFSKDIESHAQSNTKLNEDQLKRLHMILKPFMLRRVKKHVQKELGDKIELDVYCDLTYRQRAYYANLRNQISIMDLIEKATLGDDNDSKTLMNLVMQFRKVCNHPDLFERADTASPFSMSYFAETASFSREGTNVPVAYSARSMIEYKLPRLVDREDGRLTLPGRDNKTAGFRNKYLDHLMNVWKPDNVRQSEQSDGAFSWLRFADASPSEVYRASHEDVFTRSADLLSKHSSSTALSSRLQRMKILYDDEEASKGFTPAHTLFQVRERNDKFALADVTGEGILSNLMNVARATYDSTGLTRAEVAGREKATAPPIELSVSSIGTAVEQENIRFNVPMRRALYGINFAEERALVEAKVPWSDYPALPMLPEPDVENKRFTNISVPSMRHFVTDSGKLAKLDELLFKMKEEGHRVLLYFQMTRMIDLMEEYLTYRNYKYCRLDGSTKLEDRRDTVHDFQTRPEIFVFLLSTRAGGLGINLTSADTVIFYDSDWNPTIDSQAMDRAHRLGQKKQVTVYRLITRGTIEERIRKRAMQKEEVQRVVIQGGGASVDFSGRRPTDNRNRDIALWLADDEQAEEIERREKEMLESGELDKQTKKRGAGKRKRANAANTDGDGGNLEDLYHEGEGHFDDKGGEAAGAPGGKKKRGPTKKAKTAKQRLAAVDGE